MTADIQNAIDIICSHIQEFETMDIVVVEEDFWAMAEKLDLAQACLRELSATTGRKYFWMHFELPGEKLYSGVA